ncbi:MAG: ROK family glucokinase [Frankiaceae bacterium]|nr:ROK family glucokinase [Frankiaceae bacterium]MBV9369446.1 ROK family glucokinase [Frankiales bacterium]
MTLAIGVDIGGTKVAAGVVDDDGNVLARARRRTPSRDPEHLVDVVVEIVRQLRSEHDATAIGVGAAGYIDADRSTVLFSPNLPAWRNTPLRAEITERLGTDVVIENDANAAAWGEFRFGAGEQQPDVVVVTVGTGIGCGLVIGGRLYRGHFGIGGEPGHMRVVPGGRQCGCGNLGCWEQYASGTALVRAAREVATERRDDARRLLQMAGDVDGIDGTVVMRAAQEGDPAALDCFDEIGRWLGQGLADIAALLDPGRFVVGGGVADAGELLLKPARDTFAVSLTGRGYRPVADVVPAKLGADAGVIGAADLARSG